MSVLSHPQFHDEAKAFEFLEDIVRRTELPTLIVALWAARFHDLSGVRGNGRFKSAPKRHAFHHKMKVLALGNNLAVMNAVISDGQILLHGGGNFGDIGPWFQPFREEVLTRNLGRSVVQFPQTVYYQSQERLDETAHIIERHGAFTLLVRDQRGYDLTTCNFQRDVQLCPDMAFQIETSGSKNPQYDLLLHLRANKEAVGEYDTGHLTAQDNVIRQDWPAEDYEFIAGIDKASRPARALAYLKHGRRGTTPVRYAIRAKARFERGTEMLQQSRYAITDRMHGHIMCVLLDIPRCMIDNSYGKTSGFMEACGTKADNVYAAPNIVEAVRILQTQAGLDIAI